jgi:hypothetical protein
MRIAAVLLLVLCAGCATNAHPLSHTSADDPVWQIAPERWQGENALTTPPTLPAGRIPSPQAAR